MSLSKHSSCDHPLRSQALSSQSCALDPWGPPSIVCMPHPASAFLDCLLPHEQVFTGAPPFLSYSSQAGALWPLILSFPQGPGALATLDSSVSSTSVSSHLLLSSLLLGQSACDVVAVQLLSHVQLFVAPWTAAHQASRSFTNSRSLLKLMSVESVMPSNHLILCHPLLLPPSIETIIDRHF